MKSLRRDILKNKGSRITCAGSAMTEGRQTSPNTLITPHMIRPDGMSPEPTQHDAPGLCASTGRGAKADLSALRFLQRCLAKKQPHTTPKSHLWQECMKNGRLTPTATGLPPKGSDRQRCDAARCDCPAELLRPLGNACPKCAAVKRTELPRRIRQPRPLGNTCPECAAAKRTELPTRRGATETIRKHMPRVCDGQTN